MRLHALGANRQVTGSMSLLQAAGLNILVDAGLFQERRFEDRNLDPLPVAEADIDFVLLTHAHLDHVGRLPLLVKRGLNCPVITHHATVGLAQIVLEDAARSQAREAEEADGPPLYDLDDVAATLALMQPHGYEAPVELTPDVGLVMHDAGHILGSASLELAIRTPGSGNGDPSAPANGITHLVFSGDIGMPDRPIIRDPKPPPACDVLVMESTYGDRDHEPAVDALEQLRELIRRVHRAGGKLIIPTFAIERAQELLYHLNDLRESKRMPRVPVFLDSPMASKVTQLFDGFPELMDAEALQRLRDGDDPLDFTGLRETPQRQQSMAINQHRGPAIILAGSGMCTAGRVLHHLVRHLDDPHSAVLFAGYQAHGTLGREILDGKRRVRVMDHHVPVRAQIARLDGLSGHADRGQLTDWFDRLGTRPHHVLLNHGDDDAATALANDLRQRAVDARVPEYQDAIDL
jgi:metallo-beta-lactamase family protein